MPFRRARELWKKRRVERRRWRIVLLMEDGEGREENVKFVDVEGFERVDRVVVKVRWVSV